MYSTKADLLSILSEEQLAKLTSTSGVIDDVKINAARKAAAGEIDPYCQPYYSVPFASNAIPERIVTLSNEITVYNIYKNRIIQMGGVIPEGITKMYDDAISFLKTIAAGKSKIPGATERTSSSSSSSTGGWASTNKPIFE